jgi:hypothetical protein
MEETEWARTRRHPPETALRERPDAEADEQNQATSVAVQGEQCHGHREHEQPVHRQDTKMQRLVGPHRKGPEQAQRILRLRYGEAEVGRGPRLDRNTKPAAGETRPKNSKLTWPMGLPECRSIIWASMRPRRLSTRMSRAGRARAPQSVSASCVDIFPALVVCEGAGVKLRS